MKDIAVLIPTFKPEAYLEECLDCFERQTISKEQFAVYLVLNGPLEYYGEYVTRLIEKYTFDIKYSYINQAGVSNARNYLIENSLSDYITFVDDDDLVSDNYLEALLSKSDNKFMAISNVLDFEKEISTVKESYISNCYNSILSTELSKFRTRQYYSSPVAKLIHRSMIGSDRFDIKLAIGEDSLFMAQISNRIFGVKKPNITAVYFVRQRVGSASRSKIQFSTELKRVLYLMSAYTKMLFSLKYDVFFILSRIFATILHLKKCFS